MPGQPELISLDQAASQRQPCSQILSLSLHCVYCVLLCQTKMRGDLVCGGCPQRSHSPTGGACLVPPQAINRGTIVGRQHCRHLGPELLNAASCDCWLTVEASNGAGGLRTLHSASAAPAVRRRAPPPLTGSLPIVPVHRCVVSAAEARMSGQHKRSGSSIPLIIEDFRPSVVEGGVLERPTSPERASSRQRNTRVVPAPAPAE